MKNLFLFTLSYPYIGGGEKSFLQHELKYLIKSFNTLIIPLKIDGTKDKTNGVALVEEGLYKYLIQISRQRIIYQIFNVLFRGSFYFELFKKPELFYQPRKVYWLIKSYNKALHIYKWLFHYIEENNLWTEQIVFYTYWFNEATTAASLISKNRSNYRVLTRAHGIDLYEELYWNYLPLRRLTLSFVDSVCLVSNHAYNYLSNKYPKYKNKYYIYGLGTIKPSNLASKSTDNILRIVSCSGLIPIKRVDLILSGLSYFAKTYKHNIQWHHIGDGPLKNNIQERINHLDTNNLKCTLLGDLDNEVVLNYYKWNPVDVFITTTMTEGGRPVSIQEAQSFGIPTVATRVGGIPEIVNKQNGILLSEDPSPIEISNAIYSLISNPQNFEMMRLKARQNWEINFNEKINFPRFVNHLRTL